MCDRCFAQITAADGTQGVVCLRKPQAVVRSSRSGHFSRTPTGKRSAAQHSTTNDCHEPMKTTVLAFKGEEGGPAGPVPLPCRTSAMPCPGPPNGRTPLLGLAWTHAAWHWPGTGIPSRAVASSALHTLTAGFISSCHSLAFSIFSSGSAACDRTGDTREHQRCVQPFLESTPSTPL